MTTKRIKLYLPELDCEIEATVHYAEPQWEDELPVFKWVEIEKQEVIIKDEFQTEQLRTLNGSCESSDERFIEAHDALDWIEKDIPKA